MCASNSRVMRWMRAAAIMGRPTTMSSRRSAEPMVPAITDPEAIPMPMSNRGSPSAPHRAESPLTAATMSIAARTARPGASAASSVTPKSTTISSPMSCSTVPWCRKITSIISLRYPSSRRMTTGPGVVSMRRV